jgi:hypothetical protein
MQTEGSFVLVLHSGSQLTLWNTRRAGEIVWTISVAEPLTTFKLDPFTPNRVCLVTGTSLLLSLSLSLFLSLSVSLSLSVVVCVCVGGQVCVCTKLASSLLREDEPCGTELTRMAVHSLTLSRLDARRVCNRPRE